MPSTHHTIPLASRNPHQTTVFTCAASEVGAIRLSAI